MDGQTGGQNGPKFGMGPLWNPRNNMVGVAVQLLHGQAPGRQKIVHLGHVAAQ